MRAGGHQARIAAACSVASLLLVPEPARAHLVTTGLGPFYDGVMHLLLTPEDLLGLLAAVALAGLHGTRTCRLTAAVLPAVWLAAGLAGRSLPAGSELPLASAASLVILGGLVALRAALPPLAVVFLAGLFAMLHGLLNGSALATVGAGPLAAAGIAAAALVVCLLGSAVVVSLTAAWARVAVRIAGSWIAAVGVLMASWVATGGG